MALLLMLLDQNPFWPCLIAKIDKIFSVYILVIMENNIKRLLVVRLALKIKTGFQGFETERNPDFF